MIPPQIFRITNLQPLPHHSIENEYHGFSGKMINIPLHIYISKQPYNNTHDINIYIPIQPCTLEFVQGAHQLSQTNDEIDVLTAEFDQTETEIILQQSDPMQQAKQLNTMLNHHCNPMWRERFTHSNNLLHYYIQTYPNITEDELLPPKSPKSNTNISHQQRQIWQSMQQLQAWCNPRSLALKKEYPQNYWINSIPLLTMVRQSISLYHTQKRYLRRVLTEDAKAAQSYLDAHHAPTLIWPK